MKKKLFLKKILSLLLAFAMAASLPLTVLAEEATGTVDVETTAGSTEAVDVVISVEATPAEAGGTVEHTTTVAEDAVTDSGMIVDYQASSTVVTDESGNADEVSTESSYTVTDEAGTYAAEGGSESTQVAADFQAAVAIPVEEGQSEIASSGNLDDTTVSGDEKTSEDDGIYDYTTETVIQEGTVTVTTEQITTQTLTTEQENDLEYVTSTAVPENASQDSPYGNDLFVESASKPDPEQPVEVTEGYSHVLLGSGNSSEFFAARMFTEPLDENEQPAYHINGVDYYIGRNDLATRVEGYHEGTKSMAAGYLVDDIYINGEKVDPTEVYIYTTGEDGTSVKVPLAQTVEEDGQQSVVNNFKRDSYTTTWGAVQQFVMQDVATGETATTYCADQLTYAVNGSSYTMENLEDADYYDEAQAAHIRTIAENGYWGTEEGIGSLTQMRAMMQQAVDSEGNRIFTDEEIGELTDGVAMTATQFAIWTYSNDNSVQLGVNYINNAQSGGEDLLEKNALSLGNMKDVPDERKSAEALIFKLSNYLATMEQTVIEEPTSANTVITAENFIKEMSVEVVEKAENHTNNLDADTDNDAYVTDLSFALVVTPSTENGDDMIVKIVSNGKVLKEARIAGAARDGEEVLTHDGQGNYTVKNIIVTEGDQQFNITLEGIQNLEQGVYLYTSEIRTELDENGVEFEETSQTMVGLAGGEHAVNVSMTICFDLNVEDEIVATEHVWREEWSYPVSDISDDGDTPEPTPVTPEPDIPEEVPSEEVKQEEIKEEKKEEIKEEKKEEAHVWIPDETVPLSPVPGTSVRKTVVEIEEEDGYMLIPDEEVPLADVPATGDDSGIILLVALVSALGLAILNLPWKRENA